MQPCAQILSDYGSLWLALLVAATVRSTAVTSIDGKERSKPDGGFGGSRAGHGERCVSHELLPRDVCPRPPRPPPPNDPPDCPPAPSPVPSPLPLCPPPPQGLLDHFYWGGGRVQ